VSGCFHSRHEAIALARQSLDKSWIFGRVFQRLAQLLDGLVQTLIEVAEGVVRPERPLQFLPRDQLPRAPQQQRENFERLILERYFPAALAQLSGRKIQFE